MKNDKQFQNDQRFTRGLLILVTLLCIGFAFNSKREENKAQTKLIEQQEQTIKDKDEEILNMKVTKTLQTEIIQKYVTSDELQTYYAEKSENN